MHLSDTTAAVLRILQSPCAITASHFGRRVFSPSNKAFSRDA
jgi:hypothetical protein